MRGQSQYLDVLDRLHRELAPALYLEIGVRKGASLALARRSAVGVDPQPDIEYDLAEMTRIFEMTSDRFFDVHSEEALAGRAPDLVFIDGMHRFEYALRDFMNVEAVSASGTVVAIDDIYPNHPVQASRTRRTIVWAGDVWKLHACLSSYRPDLFLLPLDASPTGLLLVCGLDARNRVLWDDYDSIIRRYREGESDAPLSVLRREGAVDPHDHIVGALTREMTQRRSAAEHVSRLRSVG